jgi:hypothetical protein
VADLIAQHVPMVSRIARGLPVGGDLEYADDVTLIRSLQGVARSSAAKPSAAIRERAGRLRSRPDARRGARPATGLGWQVDAVSKALAGSGMDPFPRIVPVLCFVDGGWPEVPAA